MITDNYLHTSRVLRGLKLGPFGEHIHLYLGWLQRHGYSRQVGHRYLSLARDFGFWLDASGLGLADIREELVTGYLAERSRHRPRCRGDALALARLVSILRNADVIAPRAIPPHDPSEDILQAYSVYMERKRGLVPSSVASHVWFLRPFLRELGIATSADLVRLSGREVARYVERHAGDSGATTARIMCSRLRVFVRYLHAEGFITTDLTTALPLIRRNGAERLPSFMPIEEVRRVLDGCDRSTAIGRRDYAILMLLARLGLRACEVAKLSLEDFDWRAGHFTVHSKGRRTDIMPLPPDVGAAITSYLQHGRPKSDSRRLFLLSVAPYSGFKGASGVQTVARSAFARAGITAPTRRGSHVFRHSLATGLLRSGATLTEIGELLRHTQPDTTRIYAKVDFGSLRPLGLPWLGGEQ